MGYDASCKLTIDGKTSQGTAWLEHKDLVFRGSTRVAIPLASITSATAENGTLHVRFGKRSADFAIGAAAPKWASRIMNPPSRLDKLGIKTGMSIALVGISDPTLSAEVEQRGARVVKGVPRSGRAVDVIFYEANERTALERLGTLRRLIQPAGAVWIVRPKGRTEITEAETMAAGKRAGLVDVKVVSFSDTYTAEKFVIPVAQR